MTPLKVTEDERAINHAKNTGELFQEPKIKKVKVTKQHCVLIM